MFYDDGSIYEGEWEHDKRNGLGLYLLGTSLSLLLSSLTAKAANNNRYEGQWKNDDKHGDGSFFYVDKVGASVFYVNTS